MSDLISRQAAIDELTIEYMARGMLVEKWAVERCIDAIKNLPSAQEWIPVKYRPMTAEERKRFEEEYTYGYELEDDEAIMFDCKMPEDGQEILVSYRYGYVDKDICQYDGEFYGLEGNGDWEGITAWMPLPEPYTGGE